MMRLSTKEQILAALFAGIISVGSQLTIPLPLIPLTLQTFMTGLTVTILGKKVGTWAITIYALLGMIGLPVFAGSAGGFSVIVGPTGGFVWGFIIGSWVTGFILECTTFNYPWAIIANIIGAMVILLCGTLWLKIQADLSWPAAFSSGFVPFILPGIIKALLASWLGIFIRRRLRIEKSTS